MDAAGRTARSNTSCPAEYRKAVACIFQGPFRRGSGARFPVAHHSFSRNAATLESSTALLRRSAWWCEFTQTFAREKIPPSLLSEKIWQDRSKTSTRTSGISPQKEWLSANFPEPIKGRTEEALPGAAEEPKKTEVLHFGRAGAPALERVHARLSRDDSKTPAPSMHRVRRTGGHKGSPVWWWRKALIDTLEELRPAFPNPMRKGART